MKSMVEYAKQYQHENRNKGVVSDVTSYSFKFTENPKKPGEQPKSYMVMISYFWTPSMEVK